MNLTTAVPALAAKINRPAVVTHLEAQRVAATLGVAWGATIPASDWERIETAVLTRYGK